MEKMLMLKGGEQAEVTRLCRPDYGCDPEIKTTQSRFLSDTELFKPCASTRQKKRVSKYLNPRKQGTRKRFCQKLKLLQRVTFAVSAGAKRVFVSLLPAKMRLESLIPTEARFATNLNLKASATVKKRLALKHF